MKPTSVILVLIIAVVVSSIIGIGELPLVYAAITAGVLLVLMVWLNLVNPYYVTWYRINKGKHYSVQGFLSDIYPPMRYYNSKKYITVFKFKIPKECHYDVNEIGKFWNKLLGVAFRGGVHENSLRIGWRPTELGDGYESCFYYYEDGERDETEPFKLEYDQIYYAVPYDYFMAIYDKDPIVNSDLKPIYEFEYVDKKAFRDTKYRFLLLPYFGGIPAAPFKMNIYVEADKYEISK